jgi:hypothetical protein
MINRNCFGGEEEDVRDTFCKTRLAHFIAMLIIIAFIVTIYFTADCYIYNPSRNCAQTTVLTILFGILVFGLFTILIRWKWYFKPTVQEEEPRSYGEITPKKTTIGKHESQRMAFNPMIQHTMPEKKEIITDMAIITPFGANLETANTLLSNPMLETERSKSSSKDSSSPLSKKMSKTSKKSSKHVSSPKSHSSSARSPKLPSDSDFTIQNPMDAV